jgi:hypothetical protein
MVAVTPDTEERPPGPAFTASTPRMARSLDCRRCWEEHSTLAAEAPAEPSAAAAPPSAATREAASACHSSSFPQQVEGLETDSSKMCRHARKQTNRVGCLDVESGTGPEGAAVSGPSSPAASPAALILPEEPGWATSAPRNCCTKLGSRLMAKHNWTAAATPIFVSERRVCLVNVRQRAQQHLWRGYAGCDREGGNPARGTRPPLFVQCPSDQPHAGLHPTDSHPSKRPAWLSMLLSSAISLAQHSDDRSAPVW